MDKSEAPHIAANCRPVFSVAGVMPGASEAAWKTAYPNPDALIAPPRPAGRGPTFTIAGVMPGTAQTSWPTAMPDPTRDTLDAFGHVITKIEAARRAQLPRSVGVLSLRTAA